MKRINATEKLKLKSNEIRQSVIRMLVEAKSGHTAGALGMADVFTALYFSVLKHDPKKPNWKDRDRVILSNGHICPILYATLAHAGYFPVHELQTLRKLGSRLPGHPHISCAPGVENSAGPLGQGISIACGVAYGLKTDKKSNRVYCSLGDGELQEGQVWEAFMFAAKYKLDNLIAFCDRNYIQIDGDTREVMPLDPLDKKLRAFNWNVITINGNNMKQILEAFRKAKKNKGKPTIIIAKTTPGKGVSFIEGDYHWHGKPPTTEQGIAAEAELRKRHSDITHCYTCKAHIHKCDCHEGE